MLKRDTCTDKLKNIIKDQNIMAECKELMKNVIESRHMRVMERQRAKYEVLHQQKLGGHSNQGLHQNQNTQLPGHINTTTSHTTLQAGPTIPGTTEETKKWVINLSDQPLTEDPRENPGLGAKICH